MEPVVLEREDPEEATPAKEEAAVEAQPESTPEKVEDEKQPTSQEEPEVEVNGEKVKVSQLLEWRKSAENEARWQKSNTLKAQEIATERKRLAEAEVLYNMLQKDPARLQKILAPEPERDFDAELQAHLRKRPTEDPDAYLRWEAEKDSLLVEKASALAYAKTHQQASQEIAKKHNDSIVNAAYDEYKGKVDEGEFRAMADWVVQNIKSENNMYPEHSFKIAYQVLHGGRDVEKAKLEAAKSVGRSIEKARPASGNDGKLKQPDKEPRDEDDDAFVDEIHARHPVIKR
jgi:hypothetical protein